MVIIIGAGPAGLATARQLQKRQIPYCVLERHSIGYSWSQHYPSLRLHTLKQVSQLPDLPFSADVDTFPTRAQFLNYLQTYAAHFDLMIKTGVDVQRVAFVDDQWQIETNCGPYQARHLICSTGIWSQPFRPSLPNEDAFTGAILHANQYQTPAPFLGKRVLVVGVGNTGADIAAELSEAGVETGVALRSGVTFVPYPTSPAAMRFAAWLFRTLPSNIGNRLLAGARKDHGVASLPPNPGPPLVAYPVVGFKLVDAVKAGQVLVHPGIAALSAEQVTFTDKTSKRYDVLILATGYRPALRFLQQADGSSSYITFNEKGWPEVDRYGRSLVNQRLSCVGYAYPATSGWIQNMARVSAQTMTVLS